MQHDFSLKNINENAAQFAEAMLVVRVRIVEAVYISAHTAMKLVFPAQCRTFWPEAMQEQQKHRKSNRFLPSAKAISRAEEVACCFLPLVKDDEARQLLSCWASCISMPHHFGSFSQYCQKHSLVKRTAERHLHNIIQQLTHALLQKHENIACPDWQNLPKLLHKTLNPPKHLTYKKHWHSVTP